MKWSAIALFGALAALPATVSAQEVVPIGHITRVDSNEATTWAMSGFNIFRVTQNDGDESPITRTLKFDARTVEILSRTQSPPLRSRDVYVVNRNGRYAVVVRRYLLAEVRPQDARAEGISQAQLASRWASSVRNVLPKVAPLPSRFGI